MRVDYGWLEVIKLGISGLEDLLCEIGSNYSLELTAQLNSGYDDESNYFKKCSVVYRFLKAGYPQSDPFDYGDGEDYSDDYGDYGDGYQPANNIVEFKHLTRSYSSIRELKSHRNELIKVSHPDMGGDTTVCQEINGEYELLEMLVG